MMYNFSSIKVSSDIRSQEIKYGGTNTYPQTGPHTDTEYGTFSIDFGYDSNNNQAFKSFIDQLAIANCFDGVYATVNFKAQVDFLTSISIEKYGPEMVGREITRLLKGLEAKSVEELLTDKDPLSRLFGVLLGKLQQAKVNHGT